MIGIGKEKEEKAKAKVGSREDALAEGKAGDYSKGVKGNFRSSC